MFATSSAFLTEIKQPSRTLKTKIEIGGSTNICKSQVEYWESGSYNVSTGAKEANANRIRLIELLPVKPNTTYYVDTFETDATYDIRFGFRAMASDGTFVRSIGGLANGSTFTTGATEYYVGVFIYAVVETITSTTLLAHITNSIVKPFVCLNSETDKTFIAYDTITVDETIVTEFDIENSLSTDGIPAIGGVVSKILSIGFVKDAILPSEFNGKKIKPYVGLLLPNGFYEYIPLGTFIPDMNSITKTKMQINMNAYDILSYTSNLTYVSALTFPATVSSVLNEMATNYSLTIGDISGLPVATILTKPTNTTVRSVLCDIAELVTANAIVDNYGDIVFKLTTNTAFSLDGNNYVTFNLLSDADCVIDKLICEKVDAEETTGTEAIPIPNLEYGTGAGYALTFQNDSVVTTGDLQSIYDFGFPLTFTPYDCEVQGMPHLEVGDKITITDVYSITRTVIISKHSLVYNGGLKSFIGTDVPTTDEIASGSYGETELSKTVDGLYTDMQFVNYLVAGNITAQNIKANSISTDKLIAGQIGTNNLLRNSTFNNGQVDWTGFTGDKIIIAPLTDKPNSYIAKFNKSGLVSDLSTFVHPTAIAVNADGNKSFTISFDFKTDSIAGIDSTGVIATVRLFNDPTKTAQADSTWWINIYKSDLVTLGLIDNTWMRYSVTITPTSGMYLKVMPYIIRNGVVYYRELQVENGTYATAWTPYYGEIYTGYTMIDSTGVTINNGALIVKNNLGEVVLSGDSDGNLFVQNLLTIGGNTLGKLVIKDDLDANIVVMNTDGAFIKDGKLKISSGEIDYLGNMMYTGDKYEASYGSDGIIFNTESYVGAYTYFYPSVYSSEELMLRVVEAGTSANFNYKLTQRAESFNMVRYQGVIGSTKIAELDITSTAMTMYGYSGTSVVGSSIITGGKININADEKPILVMSQTVDTIGNGGSLIFTNSVGDQGVELNYNYYDSVKVPFGLTIRASQHPDYLNSTGLKAYLAVEGEIVSGAKITSGGNIAMSVPSMTTDVITAYDAGNANGMGIAIQGGGLMVIGAGESPKAFITDTAIAPSTENCYITADQTISLVANCNTIANRVAMTFGTTGILAVPTNITIGGDTVASYGSNANGSYIRFYDGTQICWQNISLTTVAINTAYGSLFQGTYNWTFPASFVGASTAVHCSHFKWGTSASWGTVSDFTTTSANLRGIDAFSRATGTSVVIGAIAIGRWQ